MADVSVVRYRGDSPTALVDGLLRVVKFARATADDFRFGPTRIDALLRDGLEIHGPDLAGVMEVLSTVPGLAHTDT